EQIQQNKHPLVRPQNGEQANLRAQRTANHLHPHARHEPARLWQLDEAVAFSRFNFSDDSIRNARRYLTIHHQTPHTRGPSCVPPTANHPHEQITWKQRRRGDNFAAVTATMLTQQRLVDLITSEREAVPRQSIARLLNLSAAPIHGAASPR